VQRHHPQARGDGIELNARFNGPTGIVFDGEGSLYVSDAGSFTIRKIDIATATVTTVVGVPGTSGVLLGPLPGCLGSPQGLAFGSGGELLIADQAASAILCAWL
jgi:serine/threonine protein kinase, bacterial